MIDTAIKKTVKQMALDDETTATEIYNKAIKEYVQKRTQQSTFKV